MTIRYSFNLFFLLLSIFLLGVLVRLGLYRRASCLLFLLIGDICLVFFVDSGEQYRPSQETWYYLS